MRVRHQVGFASTETASPLITSSRTVRSTLACVLINRSREQHHEPDRDFSRPASRHLLRGPEPAVEVLGTVVRFCMAEERELSTGESTTEDTLRSVMDQLRTAGKGFPDGLVSLYSEQMEWARHYNELIWMIGTILVPVSFAGLALKFEDPVIETWTALGSSGILWFWGYLAEWHRRLVSRCFELTGMIEEEWGIRKKAFTAGDRTRHLLYFRTRYDWGYYLRWGLVIAGIMLWTVKGLDTCLKLSGSCYYIWPFLSALALSCVYMCLRRRPANFSFTPSESL
jgi:hypothetical protein